MRCNCIVLFILLMELLEFVSAYYPPKCKLPKKVGRCKARFERYYFDMKTKKCQYFIYGACGGNANRFRTSMECLLSCEAMGSLPKICTYRKKVGWCKASVRRYYYDVESRMCEPFIYGGCLGNRNNFVDRNQCMQTCQKYGSWPQVCTLPKEEGPCKGAIPRFYFNLYSKRCLEFRYSGCGGNKNNFAYKKDCIGTCRAFKEN